MAITDKTLVPLGLAVVVIGSVAIFITNVQAVGLQNKIDIQQIREDRSNNIRDYNRNLIDINSRLSRIEEKLEIEK